MVEPSASEKSAEAYRTIGEVAEELKLPQHVLRFWETRFPQIRPLKRAGGRRFYRPEDLALLRAIKARLYGEGYTIKGVQRLLQEQGAKGVAADLAIDAAPRARWGDPPDRAAAEAGVEGARREPSFAAAPPAPPRPVPAPTPPAVHPEVPMPAAPRAPAVLARLEALALDLDDCARLLAAARRGG